MFLYILTLLFILFIVFFANLWSFAFYFVKFLEIKNIYKILIIFSILNLILFSTYYAYYFIEDGWFFGSCFAAGLVAVPFHLWKLYKAEKDNALIQRMPTLQDYFNKNKKRFITNKKMFFIGLFSVFISIWQIEVPQRLIVNLLPVKLEIVNDDFEYVENPEKKFGEKDNIYLEYEKEKKFLNFAYTKNNIYVCDSFDCKGDKKYIGYVWTPWSDPSILGCITGGGCHRYIKRNKRGRDYLMSFIENKKQKNKEKNNE